MKIKKILCIFLSTLMLGLTLITGAGAYTSDESYVSLKRKFKDGETYLDYCYYSPVETPDDSTKYPLVVWLHGNKSGDYKRHQLNNCLVAYWACDDAQAQFHNGGAFIYLPRHETLGITVGDLAWDWQTNRLKQCVDEFIKENEKNIDKTRIYVGGYSMGGKGAFKQLCNFPDFYAAGFLMSPVYAPLATEVAAAKNIPMWVFTCKGDIKPELDPLTVSASWGMLASISAVPDKIRHTRFNASYNMDGSVKKGDTHNTWDAVVSDLFITGTDKPLPGMNTVDGNGNNVEIKYPDGFLSWLNSQSIPEKQADNTKPVNSFIQMILNLFRRIRDFFRNLF